MNKKPSKVVLVLLCLSIGFIWCNSLLPASISAAISNWVKEILNGILGSFGREGAMSHGILRKVAHFTEFALCGTIFAAFLKWELKKYWWAIPLGGICVALIDESIQLFSEGRAAQVTDIWIDCSGFFLGIFLSWAIHRIVVWRKGRT